MSSQQYSEDNNNDSVFVAEIKIENFETKETEETTKETIREISETTKETNERKDHNGMCNSTLVSLEETKKGGVSAQQEEEPLVPLEECPICMDDIDPTKNCIVTECGHTFHCSCLMKNAATNGFGCPMCRTVMAEQLEDSDDEYEEDEYEEEDMFNDNALTSFRMFQQQIEGEEVEEEPDEEDEEDEEQDQEAAAVVVAMPTPESVATKLAARGITLEDAVKVLLLEHGEYNEFEEVYDRRAQELYGEIRRIISHTINLSSSLTTA